MSFLPMSDGLSGDNAIASQYDKNFLTMLDLLDEEQGNQPGDHNNFSYALAEMYDCDQLPRILTGALDDFETRFWTSDNRSSSPFGGDPPGGFLPTPASPVPFIPPSVESRNHSSLADVCSHAWHTPRQRPKRCYTGPRRFSERIQGRLPEVQDTESIAMLPSRKSSATNTKSRRSRSQGTPRSRVKVDTPMMKPRSRGKPREKKCCNHTDRPCYSCNLCDKCFGRRCDMKRHQSLHIGVVFNCEYCGNGYSRHDGVLRHQRSCAIQFMKF